MAVPEWIIPLIGVAGALIAFITKMVKKGGGDSQIVLKFGDSIMIDTWSWSKLKFVKKVIHIDENGDVKVTKAS